MVNLRTRKNLEVTYHLPLSYKNVRQVQPFSLLKNQSEKEIILFVEYDNKPCIQSYDMGVNLIDQVYESKTQTTGRKAIED